jgi:hypothetical protein
VIWWPREIAFPHARRAQGSRSPGQDTRQAAGYAAQSPHGARSIKPKGAEPRPAVPPRDERPALERAAELSPDGEPRAPRLVSAATIAVPSGQADCRW